MSGGDCLHSPGRMAISNVIRATHTHTTTHKNVSCAKPFPFRVFFRWVGEGVGGWSRLESVGVGWYICSMYMVISCALVRSLAALIDIEFVLAKIAMQIVLDGCHQATCAALRLLLRVCVCVAPCGRAKFARTCAPTWMRNPRETPSPSPSHRVLAFERCTYTIGPRQSWWGKYVLSI